MFTTLMAQVPQKVNYQAVARNLSGSPLVNTPVTVIFSVLQGSASGTAIYTETHSSLTTNQFGLFIAEIGGGTATLGTFSGISWSANIYYLQVTVNGDVMPATQLLSVPYALHAGTAATGTPGANGIGITWLGTLGTIPVSPNLNEAYYNSNDGVSYIWDGASWQILAQDGVGSNFVGGPGISITGNTISATDTSITNELQTISINGTNDTIFLSNGGFVRLPTATGDDWGTQLVQVDGTTITGDGDGSPLSGFDGQYSSLTGAPTLVSTFTNDAGYLTGFTEVDGSITNEIQTLSFASPNLSISGTGGNTVNLTGLVPTTFWSSTNTGSIHPTTLANKLGVGTNNPQQNVEVQGTNSILRLQSTQTTSTANAYIEFGNTSGSAFSSKGSIGNKGSGDHIEVTASTFLRFLTGGSERMRLSQTGALAIGTFLPASELHVNGHITMEDGNEQPGYLPVSDANGTMTWTDPSTITTASIWTKNATDIYFNTGRVGVGTLTPGGLLEVENQSSGITLEIDQDNSSGSGNMFGVYSNLVKTATATGAMYAVSAYATDNSSSGSGITYGVRSQVLGTNASTKYGIYSDVTGAGTLWAGYFASGDVYVKDQVGIGTTSPSLPLEVAQPNAKEVPKVGSTADGLVRLSAGDSPLVMDMGIADDTYSGAWIQSHYSTNMATQTSLLLNPNGGDVGIGSTSPSEKLDVEGSVQVDGDYTYESVKTHYLTMGETDFRRANTADGAIYSSFGNGGVGIINSGGVNALVAPVYLPNGAVVTSVDVYYVDNSAASMTFYLQRRQLTGTLSNVSSAVSLGNQTTVETISMGGTTIDNANNSYGIRVYSTGWASGGTKTMEIKTIQITYTVTKAD